MCLFAGIIALIRNSFVITVDMAAANMSLHTRHNLLDATPPRSTSFTALVKQRDELQQVIDTKP